MIEFGDWSAGQTANAIAQRQVSSREVVQAAVDRALAWQPVINAVTALHADSALAAADRADAAVASGRPLPPLHGVPMAHKDMYYREGRASGCGSRAALPVAATTSTLLQRLDQAGAIEIAALNMCEFALGPTGHNDLLGHCCNPWNPQYIAGGSSSGSGAAVAARIVPAALGSDTGGSIRLPASVCGVLGLKPTHGLLSRHGMMPLSPSIDTPGICARTAHDVALILNAIAGPDGHDGQLRPQPPPDYLDALGEGGSRPLRTLRVGLPQAYFRDAMAADVGRALDDSLRVLESLGATVVEVTTPDASRLSELSRAIVYAEAAAVHARRLATHSHEYSPQVRVRAATGFAIPAHVYAQALALRPVLVRAFVTQAFEHCDVLHLPTLAIPVPTLEETDVGSAAPMWEKIAAMVRCTAPFNFLGLPALSVPCGFAGNGVPTGFQIVGRPYAESSLLRVAAAYEQVSQWNMKLPELLR